VWFGVVFASFLGGLTEKKLSKLFWVSTRVSEPWLVDILVSYSMTAMLFIL